MTWKANFPPFSHNVMMVLYSNMEQFGWSLITGLDCGLDRWTGLLDWITGLTFELKLCVSHDLHPIRCAELGHMFDA